MKTLLLGTAMAVVFGAAASAQDLFRTEVDPAAIVASDFIGKRVYAAEAEVDADEYEGVQQGWNDIGEINDVILTRDGRVDSVLVDIGGFLGMGERQVALSMESIRFVSDSATAEDMNDFFLVINADRTTLEGAPEYMRTEGAAATDTTTTGDAAATTETATETPTEPAADADAAAEATTETTTEGTMAEGTAETTEGTATTDTTAGATADTTTEGTDAATTGGAMTREGYAAVEPASMTAEQLIGTRVYGTNDEDIGEISDIVLDANGATQQVIVDVGGFLGIGEKPVAMEMTQVQLMQAAEGGEMRAYVQMTKEEIEALPAQ